MGADTHLWRDEATAGQAAAAGQTTPWASIASHALKGRDTGPGEVVAGRPVMIGGATSGVMDVAQESPESLLGLLTWQLSSLIRLRMQTW